MGTGDPDLHPYPMEKHKAVNILMSTASDLLVNHKATQPVFGVVQSSAR